MQKLIINANILDIRNNTILNNRHIHIKDKLIHKIYKEIPDIENLEIIDVKGKIVSPGFCDCHVHVNAITVDLKSLRILPSTYVTPQAMKIMEEMLMRGFTTVRDTGGADWGIAQAVEEGYIKSPRILFGGPALSPTGGHGDGRLKGDNTNVNHNCTDLGFVCDGMAEVQKFCRDQIRKGANHIKIMVSGGIASPTDRIDSLQFSKEEISAIVEEANNANIYVVAHAYTTEAVNRALKLGVRSIEHGNLIDNSSIKLFKEHDAFLVPTLVTYYALKEEGQSMGLPKVSYDKIDKVLEKGKFSIKLAYEGGVKMAFGSDLLGDMHRRQLEEFKLLGEIMLPEDVLRSTTIIAADLLQMEGKIGEIIPGASADLLVMNGNPLDNLDILQDPENNLKLIMKDGKVFKNTLPKK